MIAVVTVSPMAAPAGVWDATEQGVAADGTGDQTAALQAPPS